MAMYINNNKLYIFVADSDAVKTNRIKGSTNSESETTNYCPPESQEQNKMFYDFLGDKDKLANKPVYLKVKKLKEYKQKMTTRIKNKYASIFKGDMSDFDSKCDSLIANGDQIIADKLFLTGSRPYLQFDGNENWKTFKEILYGETSLIILESLEDKFICYPDFHPLFIKPNEVKWEINDSDNLYEDILSHNLYGIHITNKNDALSETNPHICIGWSSMGDLSSCTNKVEMAAKYNETWPDAKAMTKAQNVGQLNRFVNEAKIGDYVLFIDYKNINVGIIESDYIYNSISYPEQDPDYVNFRKVKWIKKDIDRSIFPKAMSNSMASAMSFFKLNDYRSVIVDVLNDSYESDDNANDGADSKEIIDYNFSNKSGVNLIVYGTPGCGKSYYVQHTLLYKGGYRFDDNGINCLDAIRTTFFQDYTNTDFVGQIMPIVNADKSVTYEFNPGPFTLALNKAIQNPDKPIALVIEELNRGNAASIFGDIFQLLDRDNGTSIYNITNVNIQKYLEEQNPTMKFDYIKLPSNLSIFATMNTSDQNVFTLDTAFKRRWKFEKIKNTFLEDHKFKSSFIPGMDMDWEEFCNSINEFIVNDKNFINSEDKQLGVYFVDEKGLRKVQGDGSTEESRKEFAYKIFEYLWDDVAKYDREKWFNNIKTLDALIDKYVDEGADDKSGINVFSDGIFKKK